MTTKVDFEQTARIVRAAKIVGIIDERAAFMLVGAFARGFWYTNPRFDTGRFGFAAGLGSNVEEARALTEQAIALAGSRLAVR